MATKKISIIIVNYQSANYVNQCLASIFQYEHQNPNWEIIVLENGSPDQKNEIQKIKKQFAVLLKKYQFPATSLQLLISPTNLGFGGGNNFAAQKARHSLLFFLNGDTLFTQSILFKISRFFSQSPSSTSSLPKSSPSSPSSFSPSLSSPSFSSSLSSISPPFLLAPQILLTDQSPQPFAFGHFPTLANLLTQSEKSFWQKYRHQLDSETPPFPVDWVTGAAFIVPKTAFEKITGFDEDFFMYYEDIDLCYRFTQTFGSDHIQVLPAIQLIHLGGKSLRLNRDRQKLYFNAQDLYFQKHFPHWQTKLIQIIRTPYQLSRATQN